MATMRPVTFRRVIETCILALDLKTIEEKDLIFHLHLSKNRAREILGELLKMNLLESIEIKKYSINDNTKLLIKFFKCSSWDDIHKFLCRNYKYYKLFVGQLKNYRSKTHGVSLKDIVSKCKENGVSLNSTSIEVLADWCERLNIIQKNLYTGDIYRIVERIPTYKHFTGVLNNCYNSLNISQGLDLRLVYVAVPKVRECTCQELQITRSTFDHFLIGLCNEKSEQFELSGAPFTTIAKKSRLSTKTFMPEKYAFIDRQNSTLEENNKSDYGRGIEFGGRTYYFLAIHQIN